MSQIIYPISDTGPVYPKLDDLPVNWDLLITPDSWTVTNEAFGKSTITAITDLSSNNRAITISSSTNNIISTPKGSLAYQFGANASNTQNNFYFTRTYDTYPISMLFYVSESSQPTGGSVHRCILAPKGPLTDFFTTNDYGYFAFRFPRNGSTGVSCYFPHNTIGSNPTIAVPTQSFHAWSVYVFVFTASQARVYTNGVLGNSKTEPFIMPALNATSYYFGREASTTQRYPTNGLVAAGIALEEWDEAMVKSVTNSCSIY